MLQMLRKCLWFETDNGEIVIEDKTGVTVITVAVAVPLTDPFFAVILAVPFRQSRKYP